MRIIHTILLGLLATLLVTASVFLTLDGNLSRLTGWYNYQPGDLMFPKVTDPQHGEVTWMRIQDLHDTIECEKDENGVWWIVSPFRDRMSQEAVQQILEFTSRMKLVDTLPEDVVSSENKREFGVYTSPRTITLKVPNGNGSHSTVARYTLGYPNTSDTDSPWLADSEDGKTLLLTSYLSTDYYGKDARIHVVTGNISKLFRNGLSSLRDMHPVLLNPDTLNRISIEQEDGSKLVLTRNSAEMGWVISAPILTEADQTKAQELIGSLLNLTATRLEAPDDKDIKLPKKPSCTITLEGEGRKPLKLSLYAPFYSKTDSTQVCYAKTNERDAIFVLRAAPKVQRDGAYASIIRNVYQLPVLDKDTQLRVLPNIVYTQNLPITLDAMRSMSFANVTPQEVGAFIIRFKSNGAKSIRQQPFIRLKLCPGSDYNATYNSWQVTDNHGTVEADTQVVQQFLSSLSEVKPDGIVTDILPQDDPYTVERAYGLDNPDYTLTVAPRPCAFRAHIFGVDLPLVRAHEPRFFMISRCKNPETGEGMWVGKEDGSPTIYRLSTKLTRLFSPDILRWKDKFLFSFPYSATRSVKMFYPGRVFVYNYDPESDSWSGNINGVDVSAKVNPYSAENYVRHLQRLRVQQWIPGDDATARKALRNPEFTMSIELEMEDESVMESVIIENPEDFSNFDVSDTSKVFAEDDEVSRAMRENAFAEQKKVKNTFTIEIVRINKGSQTSKFYGRIRETGEIFILSNADGMNMAGHLLDD